jgi:F420-dependent oxidoreductase-like protein
MDLRIFTEPQLGASHADLLGVAQAARDGGFSAFFRSDHLLTMGDNSGLPGPSESFVNLGAIAALVPDIKLGTLVTSATFRHPSITAIAAAQIDDISGGRMELGIGSGWYEPEHRAYGIEFGTLGDRFDRLTEQLQIITGLWATPIGEAFDHDGKYYTLSGAPGLPKPVQRDGQDRPRIPIIIGGTGPKRTPELAARFADEYNCGFRDLDFSAAQFARVRAACEAAGRDPGSLVYSVAHPVVVGSNEAEFTRRAAAIGLDPESARKSPFAGTVDQVVDTLGDWAAAGLQRAYLQVLDLSDLDHIALIAAEVLPAVRDV